jgi:polyferredoxin
MYGLATDIVVLIHFLWILFLLFGAWWGRRSRTVAIMHGTGLAFALVLQLFGWYCPLTHLEVWLRARQGPAGSYTGSFIGHYLEKAIYLDVPVRLLTAATLLLVAGNLAVYGRMALRKNTREKGG